MTDSSIDKFFFFIKHTGGHESLVFHYRHTHTMVVFHFPHPLYPTHRRNIQVTLPTSKQVMCARSFSPVRLKLLHQSLNIQRVFFPSQRGKKKNPVWKIFTNIKTIHRVKRPKIIKNLVIKQINQINWWGRKDLNIRMTSVCWTNTNWSKTTLSWIKDKLKKCADVQQYCDLELKSNHAALPLLRLARSECDD